MDLEMEETQSQGEQLMSHPQQRDFFLRMKNLLPQYFNDVYVLEIGSLNINGTVRDFYEGGQHVGVDLAEGPGVDLVARGEELNFPDGTFDVCVSAECFEHNPDWEATFVNMVHMARQFVIFTCATIGRPEHGTSQAHPDCSPFTDDYYRNLTAEDFEHLPLDDWFAAYEFSVDYNACDLYFWGIKRA